MMFFNWKIYRTATKTTKAIRQGWTRVKGVSGDEEIGLGIHRGGGASNRIRANGSSRYEKRYEMETGVKAIQMFKYNGRWRHEKRSFLTAWTKLVTRFWISVKRIYYWLVASKEILTVFKGNTVCNTAVLFTYFLRKIFSSTWRYYQKFTITSHTEMLKCNYFYGEKDDYFDSYYKPNGKVKISSIRKVIW